MGLFGPKDGSFFSAIAEVFNSIKNSMQYCKFGKSLYTYAVTLISIVLLDQRPTEPRLASILLPPSKLFLCRPLLNCSKLMLSFDWLKLF